MVDSFTIIPPAARRVLSLALSDPLVRCFVLQPYALLALLKYSLNDVSSIRLRLEADDLDYAVHLRGHDDFLDRSAVGGLPLNGRSSLPAFAPDWSRSACRRPLR